MRGYLLERHGPPDVLRPSTLPAPEPGPGEVAVRVRAIGINYAEVLSRRGQYGWAPDLPYVLGMEAVGRITAVGPGVDAERVGEEVIVGTQHGTYAEEVVVPEARALPVMDHFDLEENAAFAVNFMTAWVSLMEMARLRPDDRVLVTAAAGGVGTAAVHIALAHGCSVIGMAGSDDKLERVRDLGASATVNYRAPGWQHTLAEAAGDDGVDVVLEVVGGEVYRRSVEALAPFGRVVVAGFAGLDLRWWSPLSWWRTWRDMPRASVPKLARESRGVLATHIGYLLADEERVARVWSDLTEFVRRHGIRPVVGRVFPFDQIAAAHRFMESRRSVGKIVVTLDEG